MSKTDKQIETKPEQSFEEKLQLLEKIVQKLETGDLSLNESINYFEKGHELSKLLAKELDSMDRRVRRLIERDGEQVEEEIETAENQLGFELPFGD